MVRDTHEIISILAIGFIWGVTNPFLRKGNQEVENEETITKRQTKTSGDSDHERYETDSCEVDEAEEEINEIECQEKQAFIQHNDEDEKFSLCSLQEDENSFVSYGSILDVEPTTRNNNDGDHNIGHQSLHSTSSSYLNCGSFDEALQIEAILTPTPPTVIPSISKSSFVHGIVKTLITFKSPRVAIPFLLNQTSGLFYYKLIATSDLTSAAYCNALAMVFSAFVGHLLGERMNKPIKALIGSIFVTIGVAICMVSDDLEQFMWKMIDNHVQGNGFFGATRRGIVNKEGVETLSLPYLVEL